MHIYENAERKKTIESSKNRRFSLDLFSSETVCHTKLLEWILIAGLCMAWLFLCIRCRLVEVELFDFVSPVETKEYVCLKHDNTSIDRDRTTTMSLSHNPIRFETLCRILNHSYWFALLLFFSCIRLSFWPLNYFATFSVEHSEDHAHRDPVEVRFPEKCVEWTLKNVFW